MSEPSALKDTTTLLGPKAIAATNMLTKVEDEGRGLKETKAREKIKDEREDQRERERRLGVHIHLSSGSEELMGRFTSSVV